MWWHRIFFGILDQTVVNAQIVYSKLEEKVVCVLNYRRTVAQALITRATPAKVGRPNLSPATSAPAKCRKSGHSVSKDVRLQNRGAHWMIWREHTGTLQEPLACWRTIVFLGVVAYSAFNLAQHKSNKYCKKYIKRPG